MQSKAVQESANVPGQSLAIIAESLYLINLLVLPGFAFLVLMWLYLKYENYSELAGCHLRQAFSASIWAGLLLLLVNGIIIMAGGYNSPYIWVIVILYFTICHSTLVILGIIALVKAMA
ncbi:MAG: hypothetical protein DRQ41_00640, partial [Gammaproteobacteria bacterium]